MKRETLHLPGQMSVETSKDHNGRFFTAYARNASVFLRDTTELRRFLKLPNGTPSRASLDSWLASLELADQQRSALGLESAEDAEAELK